MIKKRELERDKNGTSATLIIRMKTFNKFQNLKGKKKL